MIWNVLIIAATGALALWYLRDRKQVRRDVADAHIADIHRAAAKHPSAHRLRCSVCHGEGDVPTRDGLYRRCPACNP